MCNICLLTSSWTIFGIVFLLRTLFCIFLPYLDFWGPLFTKGNCVQKLIFLASAPVFSNVIEYIFYKLRAKQITWSMWRIVFAICILTVYFQNMLLWEVCSLLCVAWSACRWYGFYMKLHQVCLEEWQCFISCCDVFCLRHRPAVKLL